MQERPEGELDQQEVEEQEAVQVPGPEDTSIISAEPTGFVHGDADTAEHVGPVGPGEGSV